MNDEIVLWNGELKIRKSKIIAIRFPHSKAWVYVEGIEKYFVCTERKDIEALRALQFEMLPTTEGHDWQMDVGMTLADLKARMPEESFYGGRSSSFRMSVRPFDDVEEMLFRPWIIPVIKKPETAMEPPIVNKNPRRHV